MLRPQARTNAAMRALAHVCPGTCACLIFLCVGMQPRNNYRPHAEVRRVSGDETLKTMRRVLGNDHPLTQGTIKNSTAIQRGKAAPAAHALAQMKSKFGF